MIITIEENIKVSILCPVYNHEKYIRQALESFLAQKTDFRYEVIVNDDASTDRSAEIIREFAEKYPDIIVPLFHEENTYSKGISPIGKFMIPVARGQYFAFCEGDDYWTDENKLQIQVDWMDSHPEYSMCAHNTRSIHCDTGKTELYNSRYKEDRDLTLRDVLHGVNGVYHATSVLVRANFIIEPPDFYYISEKHKVGDDPLAITHAIYGKIHYINRTMSVYRIKSTPTAWSSRIHENACIIDRLHGAVEMYEALKKHIPDEYMELLEKTLLDYKWELLQAEGKFSELRRPPFDKIFKEKELKQRLWIYMKQYLPGAYRLYLKLIGHEESLPETMKKKK
ncbi:MAG: glycosyltransferase [Eubacteriales bacterium]|nr:glycosyltransferase [Eubacteriales bacterium]